MRCIGLRRRILLLLLLLLLLLWLRLVLHRLRVDRLLLGIRHGLRLAGIHDSRLLLVDDADRLEHGHLLLLECATAHAHHDGDDDGNEEERAENGAD